MALDKARLEAGIIAKLEAFGFKTGNQHATTRLLASAIAAAVVEEIIGHADVTGGVCAPGGAISGGKVL